MSFESSMNEMMINYILLVVCVGIVIKEVYSAKKHGRYKLGAIIVAVIVFLLAGYATIKNMSITDLKTLIEQTFTSN